MRFIATRQHAVPDPSACRRRRPGPAIAGATPRPAR